MYGGPAAPTTADDWDGLLYLFHQALAQRGFIVFSVDGPGSQIDSAAAVRRLYHRLGPASLAGQLAGIDFLKHTPYVDPARMASGAGVLGGVGVAVAPVADWALYDSIDTERYMGKPSEDAAGYRESSSIAGATHFAGRLLISHGTGTTTFTLRTASHSCKGS